LAVRTGRAEAATVLGVTPSIALLLVGALSDIEGGVGSAKPATLQHEGESIHCNGGLIYSQRDVNAGARTVVEILLGGADAVFGGSCADIFGDGAENSNLAVTELALVLAREVGELADFAQCARILTDA